MNLVSARIISHHLPFCMLYPSTSFSSIVLIKVIFKKKRKKSFTTIIMLCCREKEEGERGMDEKSSLNFIKLLLLSQFDMKIKFASLKRHKRTLCCEFKHLNNDMRCMWIINCEGWWIIKSAYLTIINSMVPLLYKLDL